MANKLPTYQIYNHFFDFDLYTVNMMYVVLNEFPRACCKWKLFDRNNTIYPKGFAEELKSQINEIGKLIPDKNELNFLSEKAYYLPKWFINFLSSYRFDPNEVDVFQDNEGHLHVEIEGLWWKTIPWEQPIMSTISEMLHHYNGVFETYSRDEVITDTMRKAHSLMINGCKFSEFGCRRRLSYENHVNVLSALCFKRKEMGEYGGNNFVGTSDIHLAYLANKEFNTDLKIIGTVAHSFITNIAALYGPIEANSIAMQLWRKNFNGDLGIFLPDSFGWKAFSDNFSKVDAKSFDGLRVDSGDEFEMVEIMCNKYKSLGVNPMHKELVFSNGLNVDKAIKIHNFCYGKINDSYGIGTELTSNIYDSNGNLKYKPMNIVIKSVACKITENRDWNGVVKFSCDEGKVTGDPSIIELYKSLLHMK